MTKPPYMIEILRGNALKVKIRSKPIQGVTPPDAVFTFRIGEPQYEVWFRRYREQEARLHLEKKVG